MKPICHTNKLEQFIRQFKMFGTSMNRLPWVILWTSGTSEVGTFCSLVNVYAPICIHEGYHFVSRPMA